jgi:Luciferase-like monooxygenase
MKFHWMLPKGGEVVIGGSQTPREAARYRIESMDTASPAVKPDLAGWTNFARRAEAAGIDSTLISFSRYEPDPFVVACALGQAVNKLKFIIAYRSGLMQPTTFVQQMNTLSALVQGRVSFNIVAGSSSEEQRGYGDYLSHDERYARRLQCVLAFELGSKFRRKILSRRTGKTGDAFCCAGSNGAGDFRLRSLGTVGTTGRVAGFMLAARGR